MKPLILCIKWGTRYDANYVNRLFAMIDRNMNQAFTFVCFTDNSEGLRKEIQSLPLPELGVPHPTGVPGKWPKVALWNKDLFGLEGTALFVDLDSVIVDNIDPFFEYGEPDDVILSRNWLKPLKKLGQTTLFRFPVGKHSYMLDEFQADSQAVAERFQFEQHYVTHNIRGGVKFWPKDWVKHYRFHCLGNNYLLRYTRPAKIPEGARIIAFPGEPNPQEALRGAWHPWQERAPAFQHLKNAFSKKTRIKPDFLGHIKCYHLPCPWIAEHWRE